MPLRRSGSLLLTAVAVAGLVACGADDHADGSPPAVSDGDATSVPDQGTPDRDASDDATPDRDAPDRDAPDEDAEPAPPGDDGSEGTPDGAGAADVHTSLDHLDRGVVRLLPADGGEAVEVVVTVPSSDEQFRRGLMDVPWLEDGTGMLFDFGDERQGAFWMKDTLVPLDIAFADAAGEVAVVLQMDPCPADPCPSYDPEVDYRYALEVPLGWFDANDLGPGDRLEVVPDR